VTEAAARHSSKPDESTRAEGESLPRRFGKYTLIRKLAAGGMAVLYLAIHKSIAGIERLLVIKRILPEFTRDQGYVEMLLKEARIATTFAHPNIVTVFDVGQVEGEYFIAMEHIHGEDLRAIVRAMKPKAVTEFPLEHALTIATGVAAGLAYAHEKRDLQGQPLRVVHRDISPQNIVVTFTGDVKVVDFGIAKAALSRTRAPEIAAAAHSSVAPRRAGGETASGEVSRPSRGTDISLNSLDGEGTGPGKVKGKIPYMSPEQARGEELDHRSDIFSLGIMLFELCTGRRLFRAASDADTLKLITDGVYPSAAETNPRVSPALDAVIARALAPEREARYQSARELQSDLEQVVRGDGIPVSSIALGEWMKMLFAEQLAERDAVLGEGKIRADEIYTDRGDEPQTLTVTVVRADRRPLYALSAVLGLVLLGAGYAWWKGERDDTARAAVRSGVISVRSTPPGAHIWLNDAPTAFRTPHDFTELATGADVRYRIRLTTEGYEPSMHDVSLATAQARGEVNATLQRARASALAVLELRTTPPGAQVVIDGRAVQGSTPLTVPGLQPGVEHTVLIRSADYLDETLQFSGAAGQVETRTLTLRERPLGADEAWLTLTTDPPSAMVRLGEREYTGTSPYRMRVNTGARNPVVHVSAPGFESVSRTVRATAGAAVAMRVGLSPHNEEPRNVRVPPPPPPADTTPGVIRVGATPWCTVSVDGTSYGQTPTQDIRLSPGRHTVTCVNPQSGTLRRTITVAAGQRAAVRFP
jgi:serine/threonine-protein kinase